MTEKDIDYYREKGDTSYSGNTAAEKLEYYKLQRAKAKANQDS